MTMDVAAAASGAQVVLATSSDGSNPPENMIDGKLDTFWTTTGLYPQEFILSFTNLMNLKNIKLHSFQVKGLQIERSVQQEPTEFETLKEAELSPSDASLQMEEYKSWKHLEFKGHGKVMEFGKNENMDGLDSCEEVDSATAKHLRFIISSGYDHFVSIHRVVVEGSPVP